MGPHGEQGEKGDMGDSGIATASYPLNIAEDGTLTIDKRFIEQLAKVSKGGKIVMQGGGGNLTAVMSDGSTINKDARHINFTGAGVCVTKGDRGRVNISIPGGDADGGFTASSQDGLTITSHFINTTTGQLRLVASNSIDITSSTSSSDDITRFYIAVEKASSPTIGPAVFAAASSAGSALISESYLNTFEQNFGKDGGQLVDGGEL